MRLTATKPLIALALAVLAPAPLWAQLGDVIPSATYYAAAQSVYSGDYRDAERALRRETQRGVRAGQTRWIDSICYHAMLGEVLYHQGRNAEALAEFDQACQLLLAYPNWLLQVKFQQPPRPDPNRARRVPPWGQSERQFVLGQFTETEQVLVGDLDAAETLRQGGVMRAPMFWRVNVIEVLRMSALAMRRRNELLGPLARHDAISKDLSEELSRGNLAPANHWSGAWIDLLRGIAQIGMGKLDEADMLLGRALVIDGRFDHPLTCVALMEQGRLAMMQGNTRRAAQLLAEAGFSAYYYENWDVLTESVLLGWINHIASGGGGVYPPLEAVAAFGQLNRFQHIVAKLRLAQAESLLWMGQIDAAAALLDDVGRRLGEMRNGLPAVHLAYGQAAAQILRGKLSSGSQALLKAMAAQARVSLRNFQIARTSDLYDARLISARIAVDVYGSLLADPAAVDWVVQPLDVMAVLRTPHDAAFDRWFLGALERKDTTLALEIAEQAKRRRYFASQPMGGRVAALRAILEAPEAALSRDALLQRQQLLTMFPAYKQLSDVGQQLYEQLRAGPVLPVDPAGAKALAALYQSWGKNSNQRQLLLAQLAVRRLPSSLEFPPLHTAEELQQSLGKGEALVVFHSVAGGVYAFLVTSEDAHLWQLRDPRGLRAGISELLREMGNYGENRQMSFVELRSDKWRKAAADAYATVFTNSRLELDETSSLVIVPDEALWHLPFEALVPDAASSDVVLADRVLIRYGPTASLAISDPNPLRRPQRTGIVATGSSGDEVAVPNEKMLQELEQVVTGPVQLPTPLPEPPRLVAPLLDWLIGFDDSDLGSGAAHSWLALPQSRGAADEAIATLFGLPYGGPERIILSGFSTAAEQGLRGSRRGSRTGHRLGDEMFHSLCGLMGDGARTILVSRWRTGGRTNFELVREFARELPNTSAAEAWQRACLLARESPLEPAREPRLKRSDETGEAPTADHPFFWTGYLLVDNSPQPAKGTDLEDAQRGEEEMAVEGDADPASLPPPAGLQQPADDSPLEQSATGAVEATDE